MTEDLGLRHSIWLTKIDARIKKIEERLDMLGSFQSMLDEIMADHKKRLDALEVSCNKTNKES